MRYLRTKTIIAIHLGIVLLAIGGNPQMPETTMEEEASAAFLVNFLKFAYFPPTHVLEPSGKVRIMCLGEDPVFNALSRQQSRTNAQFEVQVTPTLPASPNVELIVIGRSESDRLASILNQLQNSNVYTASPIPGFALKGGILEFGYATNRINYQLNVDEMKAHRLAVSSRFLKLGDSKKEKSP